jgi:hypothetical protein
MGFRNFSLQTMVNISGPWLDPEQDRGVFSSFPLLSVLLPTIEEAHAGLLGTQRIGPTSPQRIKEFMDRAAALDATHDRKLRGAYGFLTSLAEMADDAYLASSLLDLRDRLAPAGLRATMRSYAEQAGDAKLLPSRLDTASKKLLGKLKTPEGTLSDIVDAWVAAALELEQVDAQRAKLAEESPADGGVTPRAAVNARNAWIRAVRAVESNLALEKAATEAIVERLLGRLRREEARADRRGGAARKPDDAGGEAPAGESAPADQAPEDGAPQGG